MYSFPIVLCGAIIVTNRKYYEIRKRKRNLTKYNEYISKYSLYLTFVLYA